jgi:hypothetical protein
MKLNRKSEHQARVRTGKRQLPRTRVGKSARQTHTRMSSKKPLSIDDVLWLATPDREWEPIPFADADVEPGKPLELAKAKAVEAMTEWGVLVEASRASGIGRNRLIAHMRTDPLFKERMRAAVKNNNERIEREMRRRGMLAKGELAGIFVMKHNIPKYREVQRVELTGKGGGPVGYVDMKAELLKKLESLALKSRQGDAVAVGEKPRIGLLKGGSDGEARKIRKAEQGGYEVKSRK